MRIGEIRTEFADARSDDDNGASKGPFPLICEGIDGVFSVSFVNGPATGWVSITDQNGTVVLPSIPSASGARYEVETFEGTYEFFTKGDESLLTPPNGTRTMCRFDDIG